MQGRQADRRSYLSYVACAWLPTCYTDFQGTVCLAGGFVCRVEVPNAQTGHSLKLNCLTVHQNGYFSERRTTRCDHVTPSDITISSNPKSFARSNQVATNCRLLLRKKSVERAFDVSCARTARAR